jgi:flagellar biosynthesis protein FliP
MRRTRPRRFGQGPWAQRTGDQRIRLRHGGRESATRPTALRHLIMLLFLGVTLALGGCSLDASPNSGGGVPGLQITVNGPTSSTTTNPSKTATLPTVGTTPSNTDPSSSLQILGLITVLSLAPSLIMMVTGFTRIMIVLSFLRSGLGAQQVPPNQVVVGLALFLTVFVMAPTWQSINDTAITPYSQGKITQSVALDRAQLPLRAFMFRQTREKDLSLFVYLAKTKAPRTQADVPTYVLIPAFILSEIKTAFQMGFLILLPFVVIDLVISTSLMSVGMMMLSPTIVSLPFKLLLFVLVDGWGLVVRSLVLSFH